MGFRMERTVYTLPFEDTPLAGLTVRVQAMTMEERMHLYFDLVAQPDDTAEASTAKQDERYAMFFDHVVEWDLEDKNGEPVPLTKDGLFAACEPQQIGTIMGVWSSGRLSVSGPLEQPSPATRLSEIPMTVQESTPAPV